MSFAEENQNKICVAGRCWRARQQIIVGFRMMEETEIALRVHTALEEETDREYLTHFFYKI